MGISYRRVMKSVGLYKCFVDAQHGICFTDSVCIVQRLLVNCISLILNL